MITLTATFSSNRAVREYAENYYLPAAAYQRRSADKAGLGRKIVDRQSWICQHWPALQFGDIDITSNDTFHEFHVQVFPGELEPDAIEVQLYADPHAEGDRTSWQMTRGEDLSGQKHGYVYHARVSARRPASDYTARIVSACSEVALPLEASLILWQR